VDTNELLSKVLDEVDGVLRFRWLAVAIAGVICTLGWLYVLSVPSTYEARARVFVDTQGVLRPLLQGIAISSNVESGVTLVRQAMLSRPHLEKVATETGLDAKALTPRDREAVVTSLGQTIIVNTVASPGTPNDGLYTITFQHSSREKSLAVVKSLLSTFVEDSIGNKRTGQEEAQRFLKAQISEYEKRLAESEQRLADFKRENVGRMPDQRGDYFGRLQTETTALEQARNDLSLAEARRAELQRQIDGEDPFVFGFDNQLSSQAAPAETSDITARILQLEKREQDLLLRYTEKHPEVVGVRRTIEDLKAQQAAELERLKKGRGTGVLSQSTKANPVHQSLKLELNKADVQIAELRRVVAQHASAVAGLKNVADTVPQVEADVARLTRDYEVTRAQYTALVQRLETAKISENADETGTVKFEIIEPPAVGLKPVSPNRAMLFTSILFLGLIAGVGAAWLLNMLRPVYLNSRSLTEALGVPVIGVVGRVWSDDVRVSKRRDMVRFAGALGGLFALFLVLAAAGERLAGVLFGSEA
jgi:polysaccharide chain length determinant protein (PEP-CTERM system associated)